MCLITSTVQPLPNILYCCVSETAHLYQFGIVCKRAHSVGVSLLILVSVASPPTNTLIVLPPWPSINAGACPSVSYTRFCCRGCVPPLSRLGLICFTLSSFTSTTKLFCSHALADRVGDLSICTPPLFAPRGLCNIRLSLATVVRQFVLFGSGAVSSCCIVPPPRNFGLFGQHKSNPYRCGSS